MFIVESAPLMAIDPPIAPSRVPIFIVPVISPAPANAGSSNFLAKGPDTSATGVEEGRDVGAGDDTGGVGVEATAVAAGLGVAAPHAATSVAVRARARAMRVDARVRVFIAGSLVDPPGLGVRREVDADVRSSFHGV
jgi:hypothetical protein